MLKRVKSVGPAVMAIGGRYKALHGGLFDCIDVYPSGAAKLRCVASGCTFIANGITNYEDGSITWRSAVDIDYGRGSKE